LTSLSIIGKGKFCGHGDAMTNLGQHRAHEVSRMRVYIIRRLLMLIPALLLLTLLIFFLIQLIPGDIIDAMQSATPDMKVDRAALERELGLDT